MMPIQLRLAPAQVEEIAAICEMGAEIIQRVLSYLQSAPASLSPNQLVQATQAALGDTSGLVEVLPKQAVVLLGLKNHLNVSSEDLFLGIESHLRNAAKWDESQFKKFFEVKPHLITLIESEAVRIVSTALDLSYEYVNLLVDARIITDMRPVYSGDLSEIKGLVVTHTLRVRYDDIRGDREISFAIDSSDIDNLRMQCDRAATKAVTAQKLMTENKIPTIISGGDHDA